MNSQWRNIAIGSPISTIPTTIQSLTLMGLSSFLPPKRFSLAYIQDAPAPAGSIRLPVLTTMLKCFNSTTSSISYVARFVLVAMRCNPFRTIVNTPRNNKKINIIIPMALGKILIASINAAGVKTSIQPIIFLSFIYSPSYFFMPMRIAQSFISTTVVIGASPIYWLICSTASLMHFPHIGQ